MRLPNRRELQREELHMQKQGMEESMGIQSLSKILKSKNL